MTTRRKFTIAAAAGLLAAPSIARAQAVKWRMVTSWPKRLPGPGMSAERVASRIRTLSGGRIDITVYAAGEVVPGLRGARRGRQRRRRHRPHRLVLLAGQDAGRGLLHHRAVRPHARRARRLDRGRQRPSAVGRALRAVRRQAVHGRQHRRLHGRLVPPARSRASPTCAGSSSDRSASAAKSTAGSAPRRRPRRRRKSSPRCNRACSTAPNSSAPAPTSRSASIASRRSTIIPASTSRTAPASASSRSKCGTRSPTSSRRSSRMPAPRRRTTRWPRWSGSTQQALAALIKDHGVKLTAFPGRRGRGGAGRGAPRHGRNVCRP